LIILAVLDPSEGSQCLSLGHLGIPDLNKVQCIWKVAVHLQKVLEVMSMSIYIGLNPFNFIRKQFLQICTPKVTVHLQKVLEVMSTSVYTGLKPFNFIHKHFLQMCVPEVTVHLKKVLEVMSMSADTNNQIYVP
jgi:hypothetical protein